MYATVDVCSVLMIEFRHLVEYRLGCEAAGSTVHVDYATLQNRIVQPDLVDIKLLVFLTKGACGTASSC